VDASIHLHILASGSKGNAAVVEGPSGSVLVDCGIARRELHRRADAAEVDLSRVEAILVTHEHTDHTSGLPVVCKHFDGPVYATFGTAHARPALAALPFTTVARDVTLSLGGMHVQAFPLSHDVADPICFRFEAWEQDHLVDALAWATDTGVLTKQALEALHGCRILGIEANHDREMLQQGPYPQHLKVRIASTTGHLSNNDCGEALANYMSEDLRHVFLCHLSAENNHPELARKTVEAVLRSYGIIAGKDFQLDILKRTLPTGIFDLV
jgi:phosphoribosyl 1,2-cyclic phosphodiesterase